MGALGCCRCVVIGSAERGQNQFANDELDALATVEDAPHELGVRIGKGGRADGTEVESGSLDAFAMDRHGGQDRPMTTPCQLPGQGQVGKQVAQRAHAGEHNFRSATFIGFMPDHAHWMQRGEWL